MKKVQPLVSVIVPVYNVEEYLQECIDSILSQTYKNIEIILVDDGSTDNSGQICDEFAKKDKRIKIIHKANEGLNSARRDGFFASLGEWIVFVDSDDMISKNFVQYMLGAASHSNSGFVVCGYTRLGAGIDSTGRYDVKLRDRHSVVVDYLTRKSQPRFLLEVVPMKIISRELLNKVDWQKSNYKINEDEFISSYFYALSNSSEIPFVRNKLYYYRQRPGSIMDESRKEYKNSFKGKPVDRFSFLERVLCHRLDLFGEEYSAEVYYWFSVHFLVYLFNIAKSGKYEISLKVQNQYNDKLPEIIKAHQKYPLWSYYVDVFQAIESIGSINGVFDYLRYRPTVSVVVPLYNAEKFLGDCLDSVINQSYKNLEIILIDDGSTDGSGKICDKFAQEDERVMVFHESNSGVSHARNLGMERSRGEYVMFVDADDKLRLDAIDVLVENMNGGRPDLVLANMVEYHTNGYSNPVVSTRIVNESQPFRISNISKHSIYELMTRLNAPFNKLYNTSFLRSNRLDFSEELRIAEDFNFIVKVYLTSRTMLYVNDWLYYYRQDFKNNQSATGNITSSKSLDFGKSLKDIQKFIEEGGYYSKKLSSAMRMAVVDHSLYALSITEKNMQLNKDVFRYLHDDLLGYFGISEKDCEHPPHAKRLAFILQGSYEGYLFNKMNELRSYSEEQTYALHDLRKQVAEKDDEIGALRGRIDYMSSPIGMIRTPLGRAKRLAKKAAKKAIGRVRP